LHPERLAGGPISLPWLHHCVKAAEARS